MTNAAVREATIKSLQGCTLTRHHGRLTFKGVEKTRREMAQEISKAKTPYSAFPLGNKFGLADAVLRTGKYSTTMEIRTPCVPKTPYPDYSGVRLSRVRT